MTPITFHIAEVALRVSDVATCAAFYQEELGFTRHHEIEEAVFLEVGALETPLGQAGHPQLLALFDRGYTPDQARSSFDHIAFEIPNDSYVALRERFAARGMVISERIWPENLIWPGRSFFLRDPDGNVVELIAGRLDAGHRQLEQENT